MNVFKHIVLTFLAICTFISCANDDIKTGSWRGELIREDSIRIPFNFYIQTGKNPNEWIMYLYNAKEKIEVKDIKIKRDSIFIVFPFYHTELKAKISSDKKSMTGIWFDPLREQHSLKWEAIAGESARFPTSKAPSKNISGNWEVSFEEKDGSFSPAIGIFNLQNGKASATFRTETGDYRYLEGNLSGIQLLLSVFDGSHAYLFEAELKGDSLVNGKFIAGPKFSGKWKAFKNEKAALKDPESFSKVKNQLPVSLKLLNLNGDSVFINKDNLAGKVTLFQIMGTWCPNCLDESKMLQQLLLDKKSNQLQIFGLCFERSNDFSKMQPLLQKYEQQLALPYPLLFAGKAGKAEAASFFPMVDTIIAFPTLMIADKKGEIRIIHSGFNGPATGKAYIEDKNRLYQQIDKLLKENN